MTGTGIRRRRTVALTLLAAVAALALGAAPASADTVRGSMTFPAQPDGTFAIAFTAAGLPAGTSIDTSSVQVTIDDQIVPSTAKPIGDVSSTVRTTMLVLDTSGSMNDPTSDGTQRLAAAVTAANTYLNDVPRDVNVGLVTFSDASTLKVPATLDRQKVRAALKGLVPAGGTALFAAVTAASSYYAAATVRSMLVLSDGADEGKTTSTAATTVNALKKNKVVADAVSLGTDPKGTNQLSAIAVGSGGKVVATTSAATLAAAFQGAAVAQQNQILVSVQVPPTVAGTTAKVTVQARAGALTVGDSAQYPFTTVATAVPTDLAASYGPVPVAASSSSGVLNQGWLVPLALGAILIGLFGMLAVAFMSSDRESQTAGRVRRRLNRYSLVPRSESTASTVPTSGILGQSQVARSAVELAGRVVQSRDLDTGLGAKLEAAGVPLRPAEWMIVHVAIAIVTGLVFTLLSDFSVLATILGLALGVGVPYAYLATKEGRRKKAFAAQLPETLQLLSGSLSAGYSFPQAIDTVAREASAPMATELNRALVEARLGVPMEDALETVARRMDSVDFSWVVMAIRIQREVGGNLAEVLSNVAATMRERERLRRQIQVLSAEGRFSALILGGLPVIMVIYLVLVRPEYIGLLVTEPLGIVMLVFGLILMIAGAFWLRKVINVEV